MSKVTIDLEPEQIKQAFEQLNMEEKIKLVEEFERETRKARWSVLLASVRKRAKKYPISQKEINHICQEVRQERYGRIKGNN